MRLTVLDIRKKEFLQKMRGLDPDEVQAFLEKTAEEVETLSNEKKDLDAKLRAMTDQLDKYLALEQSLERTLVAAQQTAIKMEEQAKKEAELIIKDAELERDRKLSHLRLEQDRIESRIHRLQTEYESTLARLKSILAGFGTFVTSMEQDGVKAYPPPLGLVSGSPLEVSAGPLEVSGSPLEVSGSPLETAAGSPVEPAKLTEL